MAVITFYSKETKETGQTLSLAAIATHMAISHNYKILVISTNFNEKTLENCFWDLSKEKTTIKSITNQKQAGIESGFEGLLKIMASNKTSPEIISNYTRIVFKDRLDILESPKTEDYEEYCNTTSAYKDIILTASKRYDMVLVDVSKKMPQQDVESILQVSNVVIMNLTQRLKAIENFVALRDENEFFKRKNVMMLIGRYDKFSKYSNKNITRYLKEKKPLCVIPYNTLYFEACSEGKIADFFLRLTRLEDDDRNAVFIKEVKETTNSIIFKIQELQMRM